MTADLPREHVRLVRALGRVGRLLGTSGIDATDHASHHHFDHSAVVDCALYVQGRREPVDGDYVSALAQAHRRPHAFLWLGLHEPGEAELELIARTFNLHELAIEDALRPSQRPKIEQYGDLLFALLRTTRYVEHTQLTEFSEVVETGAVALFVGDRFVITLRSGAPGELTSVRADLEAKPELLEQGPWAVAHAVYDRIVDSYVACAEAVEQDLAELEESVFSRVPQRRGTSVQRIYQLKRELLEFRRAVVPLQRPLDVITAGRVPEVPKEIRRYFRDVSDHLTRTVEQVISFDDLLNSILQARLAQVTVEQNNDMRKIAAWAGIAAVWTAVAGIYGMNFHNIPELSWRYGYPAVIAVCVIASVVLYRVFRKSGWL